MGTCEECGACCRRLMIEVYWLDAAREPRLLTNELANPHGTPLQQLEDDERCLILYGPCPFLGDSNRCTIYPTRPNTCVLFEPGSAKCREVRAEEAVDKSDEPLDPRGVQC